MASAAIMVGRAVLDAAAFIGGNYQLNFSTGSRQASGSRSKPGRTSPTPTMPLNFTTRCILNHV